MSGRRLLTVVLVSVAGLIVPSSAAGEVGLSSSPALYPAFDPAVHDYIARCDNSPVQVAVSGDPTRRVGVDGDAPRAGSFTRAVSVFDSESFSIRMADAGGSLLDTYRVRCLPSAFPGFTSARLGQTQANWYVVTPNQAFSQPPPGTSQQYAAIFDNEGVPTWWFQSPSAPPVDAKVLPNGNMAWNLASNGNPGGMEERTLSGQLVRSLNTVGVGSDIHDVLLLPNGNYLLMAYHQLPGFDLTAIGGANPATGVDAEIQEIEPGNPTPVWTWNASNHISAAQVPTRWQAIVQQPSMFGTNDIYHINSFELDGPDHLILSFRALDAVYRINRNDGTIDWKLGGTNLPGKSLTVIGDPKVDPDGPLAGQHDARLLANGDLTVHDNGGFYDSSGQYGGPPPRAVRYHIDPVAMTATFVEQVSDRLAPASLCCGSSRKLPGGNWVVAWGGNPLVTELTPAGSRVFKLRFAPPFFSYRAAPVLAGELTSQALQTGMDAQHPRTALTLSGASGAFGAVTVGTQSASQTFTVTNSGQGAVQIATTELSGSDAGQYTVSGCAAQTLGVGESCTASVRFTPTSTGAHDAATLRVTSDADSGPNAAALTGTGATTAQPPGAPPPPPPAVVEPPSNVFALPKLNVSKTGTISARVRLPGAGKLAGLLTMRKRAATRAAIAPGTGELVLGRGARTAATAGTITIKVRLNSRGRSALRAHHGRLRVKLRLRFKPAGGPSMTKSKTFTLKVKGL